jgi:hypothetical protein
MQLPMSSEYARTRRLIFGFWQQAQVAKVFDMTWAVEQ